MSNRPGGGSLLRRRSRHQRLLRAALVSFPIDSHDKRVTRAPPAIGVLPQRAALDEIQDVTVGRVLRALGELGVFGCRELSLEAVEQSVQHLNLARIQRLLRKAFPE